MKPLTPKQQQVLDFIRAYIAQHELYPTIREIKEYFGFSSVTGVVGHLTLLAKKGHLRVVYRDGVKTRRHFLLTHRPESTHDRLIQYLKSRAAQDDEAATLYLQLAGGVESVGGVG